MVAYTTTYSFAKPTVGDDEDVWGGYLNGNFDTLESLLKGTTALTAINVTGNITVGGNVDGRDIAADGTKLDGIESGATADQTKADIDALNINAATLDSLDSTQFLRSDASDTATGVVTFDNDSGINVVYSTSDTTNITGYGIISNRAAFYLRPTSDNASTLYVGSSDASYDWSSIELKVGNNNNVNINGNTVWHAGNDGSGSGLDADNLDGRSWSTTRNSANTLVTRDGSGYTNLGWINTTSGATTNTINKIYASYDDYVRYVTPATLISQEGIWTSSNDGSGSGLDADTTDGYQASESNTGSTLAARTSSGNLYMNYGISVYLNMSHTAYQRDSDTIFYSSGDSYIRKNNATGFKNSLGLGTGDSPTFNNAYLAGSLYRSGDTDTGILFGTNTITLQAGGSSEITVNTTGVRLGDTGNGYFQPVSGNYGSIQIDGGAHGSHEGYSIGGRAVFMHDNASRMGLYDDVNNEWGFLYDFNSAAQIFYNGLSKLQTTSSGVNINGDLNAVDNIYVAGSLIHEGDTDTYIYFQNNLISFTAGNNSTLAVAGTYAQFTAPLYNYSVYYEDYDALSGTSVTVHCNAAQAFSLTMTGNTTFTFNSVSSAWSTGFVLELTGNGGTVTWPTSVDWAGGTAPDAPASGETDIYVFWTRDGGTTWYGVLSVDAAA